MPLIKSEHVFYVAVILLLILILAYFSSSTVNIYKKYTYFDYNGTTPPYPSVIRKMTESAWLGNASGVYAKLAKANIEAARTALIGWLTGGPAEGISVIFNSGASEGNNMILRSVPHGAHIVMSSIEHKTSIDCAKQLIEQGRATVTFVEPNANGVIDPVEVASACTQDTRLVSIMHANNEIGTINDITAISEAVRAMSTMQGTQIMFHTDIVQTIGKYPGIMIPSVDAVTMSFHKIYGPAGLGALVVRDTSALVPQITGTQNNGLRGGTENVSAISAVPETLRIISTNRDAKNERMQAYKDYVMNALAKHFTIGSYIQFYGQSDDYDPFPERTTNAIIVPIGTNTLPSTLYFSVINQAPLLNHFCNIKLRDALFDKYKIVTSIGSACSASSSTGSHVLNAIKAPYIIRCGAIRISFGDTTTMSEVRKLTSSLCSLISQQIH